MRFWLVMAALLPALGCGEGRPPSGAGGMGGGEGGAGGDGGGGAGGGWVIPTDEHDTGWTPIPPESLDGEIAEAPRPESCNEDFGFISAVRGWVAAPGGKPLPNAYAQLCVHTSNGTFVCLNPAPAGEDGVYTVDVPEDYRCLEKVAMRVLLPKNNRAISYCAMDPSAGPVVRLRDPSVLPFANPATELPAKGDVNAPRDVTFDDGLVLEVTPSGYYSGTGGYERLSGRRVDAEAVGLCDESIGFDGLYAFFPEGEIDAPGFGLRIPNTTEIPSGETVDLFVLGGLKCELYDGTPVPEATWAKFGEGTVSDDGKTIVSDEGSGLPCFTWLGYRARSGS